MRSNTPRPIRTQRGFGTLIGNGWLREAAQVPRGWDLRSKSAMRKCMFMQVPPELKALAPPASPLLPVPARRQPQPVPDARPRDPRRDARLMPKYQAETPRAVRRETAPARWWEDPVALGTMLILVPPIGLVAVWASKRYSNDARWALTVMTALTMCLVSVVTIVLVLR